jgi:hypothetical protein
MSVVFGWKKRPNTGLALVLIGLAGIAQSLIVLHAETVLQVTGVFLLILIPLGASIALGGISMSFAEAIYMRFAVRDRRVSRWKKDEHRGLVGALGRLEGASVFSALFVLVFSSVLYLSIIAACQGTSIPYYLRFALAEVASALVVSTVSIIVGKVIGSKARSPFSA